MDLIQEYHADNTRLSKSTLDMIRRSPFEYYCRRINPNIVPAHVRQQWAEAAQSRDFVIGDALDRYLLENHKFRDDFYVTTDKPRNTRDGREEHNAISRENAGKRWLSTKEFQLIKDMAEAIKASQWSVYIDTTSSQQTVLGEIDGVPVKCRPDWQLTMADDTRWCFDLKTIDSLHKWERHVMDFRYYVQDPFYSDIVSQSLGGEPVKFAFMVVEKEWPHRVAVRVLNEDVRAIGRQEYLEDLATYKQCLETGHWPKRMDDWEETQMPAWWLARNRNLNL